MKRLSDRDTPPRSKRSRSRYDREDSREADSPDFEYRSRGRPGPEIVYPEFDYEPRKFRSPERDGHDRYHSHSSSRRGENKPPGYRSLCLTNITSKISDTALKDILIKEFAKFGEFNIKIQFMGEQRVAYVNFRYPEDARAAKHARLKILLYERQIVIDAVRSRERRRSRSPSPSYFPPGRDGPDPHLDMPPEHGLPPPPHMPPYFPPGPGLPPPPMPHLPPPMPFNHPGPGRPPLPGPPPPRFDNREFLPPPGLPPRDLPPYRPFEPPMMRPPIQVRPDMHMEKFPHHLSHINPEDDPKANRTLFVGNLDPDVQVLDLRAIFDKIGHVEDVDIKRPPQGNGNSYAFVKFFNLDFAHRAKVEMSGHYIGRYQCKIGYGRAQPTNCLWVGGLGPWITLQVLEREFDRFGVITKIDWPQGKAYAYIIYSTIDAAQAAIGEMRGAPLGGPDRRLRVDFSDPNHINMQIRSFTGPPPIGPGAGPQWRPMMHMTPQEQRQGWSNRPPVPHTPFPENERRGKFDYRSRSPEDRRDTSFESKGANDTEIENATNMTDLSTSLPVAWSGALILKNNAFPACMHIVSGDVNIVDKLMRDPSSTETPVIRITQRLRLDDTKLDDVGKRIQTVGPSGHCILLALPSSLENYQASSETQQRPLKNLISYLNKKDAAGVVSLPPNVEEKDNTGILYAFPPCSFGYDILHKKAPNIQSEAKEDHLMVVVVNGTS